MASKRKVRRRVAKALRKYVRGNAGKTARRTIKKRMRAAAPVSYGHGQRIPKADLERFYETFVRKGKHNPPRVKGRKTKGGRAVTLKNFTGTIVKKSDGTVQIVGRGRRK